jgi:hypothetical protein
LVPLLVACKAILREDAFASLLPAGCAQLAQSVEKRRWRDEWVESPCCGASPQIAPPAHSDFRRRFLICFYFFSLREAVAGLRALAGGGGIRRGMASGRCVSSFIGDER